MMITHGFCLPWWARALLWIAFVLGAVVYHIRMTIECVAFGLGSWLAGLWNLLRGRP